jgi:hypothetical protein
MKRPAESKQQVGQVAEPPATTEVPSQHDWHVGQVADTATVVKPFAKQPPVHSLQPVPTAPPRAEHADAPPF